MPRTKNTKSVSEPSFSRYDTRSDLGYGRASSRFHNPRSMSSSYPYTEEDSVEDSDFEDSASSDSISKKTISAYTTDFGSKKGLNPFYFAAGNTKLSDCFERPDDVLREVISLSNSISPAPSIYKKRSSYSSGSRSSSNSVSQSSSRKTGSRRGFSSSPPDLKYHKKVNDEDENIFNLKDLAKSLVHERRLLSFLSDI